MTNGDDKYFKPTLGYLQQKTSIQQLVLAFQDLANMKISKCKQKYLPKCPPVHKHQGIRNYTTSKYFSTRLKKQDFLCFGVGKNKIRPQPAARTFLVSRFLCLDITWVSMTGRAVREPLPMASDILAALSSRREWRQNTSPGQACQHILSETS